MPSVPLPFTLPFFEKVDVFVVMDLRHRQLDRHFCPRVAALGTMSEAMRSFGDMARNGINSQSPIKRTPCRNLSIIVGFCRNFCVDFGVSIPISISADPSNLYEWRIK